MTPPPAMYDAPLDGPTQVAWIVLAVAAAVLAARAVRVELRAGRAGTRSAGVRAADVALDVVTAAAVLGLLVALAAVVLAVFG